VEKATNLIGGGATHRKEKRLEEASGGHGVASSSTGSDARRGSALPAAWRRPRVAASRDGSVPSGEFGGVLFTPDWWA
jgi:hypothetical protein